MRSYLSMTYYMSLLISALKHCEALLPLKLQSCDLVPQDGVFRRVVQFHFIGWTTQFLPSVPDFVGFMINVMERAESLKKNQRVLTHDT